MSTSLLHHAFGIRGYKYRRTEYDTGQVIFTIYQEPKLPLFIIRLCREPGSLRSSCSKTA